MVLSKSMQKSRRSQWQMLHKVDVHKYFAKFTGKHLCRSLFFNIIGVLRTPTLFKKRLQLRCFPVNFVKFLKTLFL